MRENRSASAGEQVPPANETERQLVEIWQELLLVRPIGTNEDFLALGGNSVQVMQMLRLAGERGLSFSAREVFEAGTVKELARKVRSAAPGQAPAAAITVPAFFHAHAGADRRFHAVFDCPEGFAPERLGALAQALAARHETLRLRRAEGDVPLPGSGSKAWADEHVYDGLALPPGVVERLRANPFAPLPAACPACDGRRPWYLAPVAQGPSGELLILAVFSWAVCDKPGADVLCREIEQFLRSGTLPDAVPDSWSAWLAGLPEALRATPATAHCTGARRGAKTADAAGSAGSDGAGFVAVGSPGIQAVIDVASGMAACRPAISRPAPCSGGSARSRRRPERSRCGESCATVGPPCPRCGTASVPMPCLCLLRWTTACCQTGRRPSPISRRRCCGLFRAAGHGP
jgi:hypothetical protein